MGLSPRALRLSAMGLVVTLAFGATLVWASPGASLQGPLRTGYDSLSSEEQEQARILADQHSQVAVAVNSVSRSELLLVERRTESKAVIRSGNCGGTAIRSPKSTGQPADVLKLP